MRLPVRHVLYRTRHSFPDRHLTTLAITLLGEDPHNICLEQLILSMMAISTLLAISINFVNKGIGSCKAKSLGA